MPDDLIRRATLPDEQRHHDWAVAQFDVRISETARLARDHALAIAEPHWEKHWRDYWRERVLAEIYHVRQVVDEETDMTYHGALDDARDALAALFNRRA